MSLRSLPPNAPVSTFSRDASKGANSSTKSSTISSFATWSPSDQRPGRSISPVTGTSSAVPDIDSWPSFTQKTATRGAGSSNLLSNAIPTPSQCQQSLPVPHVSPQRTFEDPKQIPGLSPVMFVYPYSSGQINEAFQNRYHELVEIFRQSVEKDTRLMDNVRHIGYELRLCGTSPQAAHPSILVFCRTSDYRTLRSLLEEPRLKRQYALRKSSRLRTWIYGSSPYPNGHKPLFNLVFCRDQTPWILLGGGLSLRRIPNSTRGDDGFTTVRPEDSSQPGMSKATDKKRDSDMASRPLAICGNPVRWIGNGGDHEGLSTISCVIYVGDFFYCLTTAHPARSNKTSFRSHSLDHPVDDFRDASEQTDNLHHSDFDESDADDYFMNDFTYESLSEDETSTESAEVQRGISRRYTHAESHEHRLLSSPSLIVDLSDPASMRFPILSNPHGDMDLDWALIKLDKPPESHPNSFLNPSTKERAFLSTIATDIVIKETPVYIIISPEQTLEGMLQPSVSFQGGMIGAKMTQYWTVTPSAGSELRRGYSGSLVIDAATHIIYGYVIAVNLFGEVHISPLSAVFSDIQAFSGLCFRLYDADMAAYIRAKGIYPHLRSLPKLPIFGSDTVHVGSKSPPGIGGAFLVGCLAFCVLLFVISCLNYYSEGTWPAN